jgi:hypothetical protein
LILGQIVGVEYDDCGIAAKTLARKRIDMKQPTAAMTHG